MLRYAEPTSTASNEGVKAQEFPDESLQIEAALPATLILKQATQSHEQ
jgi:hypothetical protein